MVHNRRRSRRGILGRTSKAAVDASRHRMPRLIGEIAAASSQTQQRDGGRDPTSKSDNSSDSSAASDSSKSSDTSKDSAGDSEHGQGTDSDPAPSDDRNGHTSTSSTPTQATSSTVLPSPTLTGSTTTSSSTSICPGGCPFCCIADNDPRVSYTGSWTLGGLGSRTTHSTVASGSMISLTFNGSAIFVYGTIPQSNASFLPPNTTYQVDTNPPFITVQPTADHSFDNQPLFTAMALDYNQHQINITVNSAETPYTFDFFFIQPHFPNATTSIADTAATSSPSPSAEKISTTLLQVLAVLLSIAVLTLAGVVIYLFYRRRKRIYRCGTSISYDSRSPKERDIQTMFTSTESILQNPSSMMFYDSQSRQSRASDCWTNVYPPLPVAFGYPPRRSGSSLDISPHKV